MDHSPSRETNVTTTVTETVDTSPSDEIADVSDLLILFKLFSR